MFCGRDHVLRSGPCRSPPHTRRPRGELGRSRPPCEGPCGPSTQAGPRRDIWAAGTSAAVWRPRLSPCGVRRETRVVPYFCWCRASAGARLAAGGRRALVTGGSAQAGCGVALADHISGRRQGRRRRRLRNSHSTASKQPLARIRFLGRYRGVIRATTTKGPGSLNGGLTRTNRSRPAGTAHRRVAHCATHVSLADGHRDTSPSS